MTGGHPTQRIAAEQDADRVRRDYARNIDNRVQAALLALAAIAAMLLPALLRPLVDTFGVRAFAAVLAVATALSAVRAADAGQRLARIAAAAVPAAAAVTGSIVPLQLMPSLLYAALAAAFVASLAATPFVERVAKQIQPAAPDFIAPYCRRVTVLWSVVFAANAIVLAVAALRLPIGEWEWLASRGVWTWMAAITAAEFFVRKTYFRNYWYRGPFERLWSRWFPAEATPMGRRSAEHIRQTRRKLGLED